MGIELEVRDLVPYLSEIACTKRRVMTPALPFTAGNSSSSTGPNNEQPAATPRPPPGLEHLEAGDSCGGAPVAPEVGSELKPDEPVHDDEEGEKKKKKYLPDPDSTEHLFTHSPAHPDCEACQRGKQESTQRRIQEAAQRYKGEPFGAFATADHLVSKSLRGEGWDGEEYAIVMADLGTGWLEAAPDATKNELSCVEALYRFSGTKTRVGAFKCDNAP